MTQAKLRGFTMIEMSVVMAIIGVALFTSGDFLRNIVQLNQEMRGLLAVQDEARRAFKTMTQDLRITSYADTGSYPITTAEADNLTFFADADADGKAERIRYFLSGTTLKRGVIVPAGSPSIYDPATETIGNLVTDMNNGGAAIFSYFDSSYTGTGSPLTQPVTTSVIRLVRITITVNKNFGRAPSNHTFSTQISLRNLKENL
jgi:prepilin-type N-terminal cleavage/methylation domain-containing protein